MSKSKPKDLVVVLHNLRSAENVGSIFRTAEACGVSRILLSGYTPRPLDRFGRATRVSKSALGAEKYLPWEQVSLRRVLLALKKEGYTLVAAELYRSASHFRKIPRRQKLALFFGNEVAGLKPSLLKQVDMVLEIPMRGRKESLNVAVAAGIILAEAAGL